MAGKGSTGRLVLLGVAEQVTPEDLGAGLSYPPQSDILKSSLHVAEKVAELIFARGLASVDRPGDVGTLSAPKCTSPSIIASSKATRRTRAWLPHPNPNL
jgi:hypothetical protein